MLNERLVITAKTDFISNIKVLYVLHLCLQSELSQRAVADWIYNYEQEAQLATFLPENHKTPLSLF